MGLVGIWSMHFIGNRAIILGDGNPNIQLVYSSGFTTLSVFLPIIGLTIAFAASETSIRSRVIRWCLSLCTGIFAGLSIVGMHYIGNLGISNYRLRYAPQFLAASIIISIGDCILVLMLFYAWRKKWITSWWKRLACGSTLAGGVTAMHFAASTRCTYILIKYSDKTDNNSRNVQVLVAGILCGTAAVLTLLVLLIINYRSKVLRSRSQKVMLACAMFDPDGQIMVTTEGVLPAREITDKYHHRSFDEDLDIAHPVFHWIMRVTHNWSTVLDLISKMKTHVNAHSGRLEGAGPSPGLYEEPGYDPQTYKDYSIIFRERFCVAAASLAASMNLGLQHIGVLYDKIIDTGTLSGGRGPHLAVHDLEKNPMAPHPFGRGQLLFLTKQLDQENVDRLLNAGFRFASIQRVGRNVAEAMQIPISTLETHMADIERFTCRAHYKPISGTRLSCFVMIPKLGRKGFDVLVERGDHSRLPSVALLSDQPIGWQVDFMSQLDGMRSSACKHLLQDMEQAALEGSQAERQFAPVLFKAITDLSKQIPSAWFEEARFFCQPLKIPPHRWNDQMTTIFAFCVIADVHTMTGKYQRTSLVPLNFFNTVQRCSYSSRDHNALAREVHQEFAHIFSRELIRNESENSTQGWRRRFSVRAGPSFLLSRPEQSLDKAREDEMHEMMQTDAQTSASVIAETPVSPDRHLGGILVNSETVVATDAHAETTYAQPMDGLHLGSDVSVGAMKVEETFVDQLVAVARNRFLLPRPTQ